MEAPPVFCVVVAPDISGAGASVPAPSPTAEGSDGALSGFAVSGSGSAIALTWNLHDGGRAYVFAGGVAAGGCGRGRGDGRGRLPQFGLRTRAQNNTWRPQPPLSPGGIKLNAVCAAAAFCVCWQAPSLLCSACDKLGEFVDADDALVGECRGCCTEEVSGHSGTYAQATLDICK